MFEEKIVLKVNEIVSQLKKQLAPALYDIGFFDATIDNPVAREKIQNSFSGHAADIAIRAVATKLVMFTTRSWDNNGNSIKNFLKHTRNEGDEIARISSTGRTPSIPRNDQRIQALLDQLVRTQDELTESLKYKSLLLLRNEHIAHPLEGKSDISKKLKKDNIQVDQATYSDILRLSKQTAEAICSVIYIWDRTSKDPESAIGIAKRHTEEFWRQLPVLSKTEKITAS
ncbi:hypothetical protein [Pseudophaeobacter sp.]|uniref:AbiU2 domain-containing protein n=1 Tax=Pseudophaeobacter sp. TaxID=1971739 RepID=UPI00329788BC